MKPADSAQGEPQGELYQVRLRWLLDQRHPLYQLGEAIDWEFFAQEFGVLYVSQKGRPGTADAVAGGMALLEASLRCER